jgi:hypothetical protein
MVFSEIVTVAVEIWAPFEVLLVTVTVVSTLTSFSSSATFTSAPGAMVTACSACIPGKSAWMVYVPGATGEKTVLALCIGLGREIQGACQCDFCAGHHGRAAGICDKNRTFNRPCIGSPLST